MQFLTWIMQLFKGSWMKRPKPKPVVEAPKPVETPAPPVEPTKPIEPPKPVDDPKPAPVPPKPPKTVLQKIYERAFAELNVAEISPGHNPRILEYHSVTSLKAQDDETPWCASFVSWVLEREGIRSTKSARARSYTEWGKAIAKPEKGCIVVFSRGSNPTFGHVAFYSYESDTHVWVLGGNQGNRVSIAPYPKSRVLSYRIPSQ